MADFLFFFVEDMSTLTPAQRLKFLEKARAKKAQPDNKVDVLSQLEVAEGDRKKRKAEPARVSVAIPDKESGPSAAAVDEAVEAQGETHLKSPAKKKLRSLATKDKKNKDAQLIEKVVRGAENVVAETMPIADKNVAVASQAGGSSRWDPLFNPEVFLERMVDMAGNSTRFNTTPTDELLKMALGHELKGLLLNYALAACQRAEITTVKEKEALVGKNLTVLEEDLNATKEKLQGEVETLEKGCEEEISKLVKAHEEELAKAKKEQEAAMKTAKTLQDSDNAKDNEAALSELATLRQENKKWVSEKENLEENVGLQYDEGFKYALDQVKVVFPDIDHARLGEADAMLKIDGGKLVPYAPVETTNVEESPAKE
jgi:hypothetical protein